MTASLAPTSVSAAPSSFRTNLSACGERVFTAQPHRAGTGGAVIPCDDCSPRARARHPSGHPIPAPFLPSIEEVHRLFLLLGS
ncbi:hypothetical protein Celaphus_00014099 [Cervus elaphus hippelaphus]|uniref:Uncharacterized protein n=1 Tax=Cervus elaphus hippelaphus TaxID=46360 RepID=A0A212CDF9_CEREH|nr:hypothetical protein Celaphus_00014099 [Cervus elaphus hippelaphus]